MAKVYSLKDMKREMRGDKQKACKKGKIALKLVDLYLESWSIQTYLEQGQLWLVVLGEVGGAH